tara:strand:- start:517 stop:888 length:372 start_codon:yes stop_codon:yes gene_type:complete
VSIFTYFLISWISFTIIGSCANPYRKAPHNSSKEKIFGFIFLLGVLGSSLMIFKGIQLWLIGFDIDLGLDSSEIARLSAKGGGKGGIILLALEFLPAFLVFGFGFLLWKVRELIIKLYFTFFK